jgi:hypothetical protein
VSGGLKASLPTGPSGPGRFVRLLRGETTTPGAGAGVPHLIPTVAFVKSLGGQRLAGELAYALPLGTEAFTFTAPADPRPLPWEDSGRTFEEEIVRGGAVLLSLNLDTSLNWRGITPGFELGIRMHRPGTWTENGADALAPQPVQGQRHAPTLSPGFLKVGAWAAGGLALEAVTEVEAGVAATWRTPGNDTVRAGLSFLSSAYGGAIGFKLSFTNLLIAKSEDQLVRESGGRLQAREVNVSPLLDAPAAPSGRILVGVTFPYFADGLTQEEADWTGQRLRDAVRRLRGYDLMEAPEMAQLAYEPCGNAECGARFGDALKLDAMIVSGLSKEGEGFLFQVALVNVADGTAAASDAVRGPSLESVKEQLPELLGRLTQPAPAPPAGTP